MRVPFFSKYSVSFYRSTKKGKEQWLTFILPLPLANDNFRRLPEKSFEVAVTDEKFAKFILNL